MKCRRLDSNWDYTFGNNSGNFIEGNEAIAQCIKSKLLLLYNEWWENISIGIPFFKSILGNVSNKNADMAITMLVTKRILEIEEVKEVNNVELINEKRGINMKVEVTTIYGDLTVEVS